MVRCLLSKAHLARLLEVSGAAVAGWCRRGHLYGDALIGTGRAQLVDLDVALQQLRGLDVGQSLGHGRTRDDAVDRITALRATGWRPEDEERGAADDASDGLFPPVLNDFRDNPIAIGAAAMACYFINHIAAAASIIALKAGASIEAAYAMESTMTIAACSIAEEGADEIGGFDLRDKPLIDMKNMDRPDWVRLAKRYGVTFEKQACDAYSATIFPASAG